MGEFISLSVACNEIGGSLANVSRAILTAKNVVTTIARWSPGCSDSGRGSSECGFRVMKRSKWFYGWHIVSAGIAIGTLTSALFAYGFSAFFMPWKDQFGWTRAQLGGVVGLARLEGGIAGPITGWCVDTFGPRKMMFAGISAMGGGFLLLSRISSITQLYLVFLVFLALGSSFGTFRPLQVAIANWFMRKRGRAMGLLMSGSGLGGSLVFLLAILIERVGWQSAAVTAGVLMWVIGLPLTAVVRHRPSDMGLNIDGDPDPEEGSSAEAEADTGAESGEQRPRKWWQKDKRIEPDLGVWQALRTPAFWILALTYAVWAAMPGITTVHVAPFLQEQLELEYVTAVGALSFFVAASIIGRLGFGALGDYVDTRIIMSGLFIFQGIGLFLFSTVTTIGQVPFYVIVFAIPYGGTIPMRSIIQGYFFGRRSFGTISGLLQFVDLPATVAAPIWVGWLADTLPDGYRIGFKIIALTMGIAAVVILFARRPEEPFPSAVTPRIFSRGASR